MAFARAYYHWFLMLQPAPLAEKMVAAVAVLRESERAVVGTQFDPGAQWCKVARNVMGHAIDCGHFVPEEKPAPTLAAIPSFLARHVNA